MKIEHQYWQHKASGATYAVRIIDGEPKYVTGPLHHRDVNIYAPVEYSFDDRFEGDPEDYALAEMPSDDDRATVDAKAPIELPGTLHQIQEQVWDEIVNIPVEAFVTDPPTPEQAADAIVAACLNEVPPTYRMTLTGSTFTLRELLVGYIERH